MNKLGDAPRHWIPAHKYGRVMIFGRRCEVRKNDWPNRGSQRKNTHPLTVAQDPHLIRKEHISETLDIISFGQYHCRHVTYLLAASGSLTRGQFARFRSLRARKGRSLCNLGAGVFCFFT
jgi:hypothetical protein